MVGAGRGILPVVMSTTVEYRNLLTHRECLARGGTIEGGKEVAKGKREIFDYLKWCLWRLCRELFKRTNLRDGIGDVFLPQRGCRAFHLTEGESLDCFKHNTTPASNPQLIAQIKSRRVYEYQRCGNSSLILPSTPRTNFIRQLHPVQSP